MGPTLKSASRRFADVSLKRSLTHVSIAQLLQPASHRIFPGGIRKRAVRDASIAVVYIFNSLCAGFKRAASGLVCVARVLLPALTCAKGVLKCKRGLPIS